MKKQNLNSNNDISIDYLVAASSPNACTCTVCSYCVACIAFPLIASVFLGISLGVNYTDNQNS